MTSEWTPVVKGLKAFVCSKSLNKRILKFKFSVIYLVRLFVNFDVYVFSQLLFGVTQTQIRIKENHQLFCWICYLITNESYLRTNEINGC